MSRFALVSTVLLLAACSEDGPTESERLSAEAAVVAAWGNDATIRGAITAQNQQGLSAAVIQQRDAAWTAGTATELELAMRTGACADRLRQLAAQESYYSEVLIMDNQGALVCSSQRTSDYWQGDEDKWIKAFNAGAGATFIDDPALDESTGERQVQISIPVMQGSSAIGVVTVGVILDEF